MNSLVKMGIYSPRSKDLPGGLAILTEIGADKVKFVIVEEEEVNQPLSFDGRGAFTVATDDFLSLFEYSGMYERPVGNEDQGRIS